MAKQFYDLMIHGKKYPVWLSRQIYLYPRTLCVRLHDVNDEAFATITTNLCSKHQSFTKAFVDTNNCPWAEQFLVGYGIARPIDNFRQTYGFCSYPLYEFDLDKLSKILDYC